MATPAKPGEEFREDLRPLSRQRTPASRGGDTAALRRMLSPEEIASLTELDDWRSLRAIALTVVVIGSAVAFGLAVWPSPWLVLCVAVIGVQQHAMFILAHDAAHYRLFRSRTVNDVVGRAIGMAGGISMCT